MRTARAHPALTATAGRETAAESTRPARVRARDRRRGAARPGTRPAGSVSRSTWSGILAAHRVARRALPVSRATGSAASPRRTAGRWTISPKSTRSPSPKSAGSPSPKSARLLRFDWLMEFCPITGGSPDPCRRSIAERPFDRRMPADPRKVGRSPKFGQPSRSPPDLRGVGGPATRVRRTVPALGVSGPPLGFSGPALGQSAGARLGQWTGVPGQSTHWPGGQLPVLLLAAATRVLASASADGRFAAVVTRSTEQDVWLVDRHAVSSLAA